MPEKCHQGRFFFTPFWGALLYSFPSRDEWDPLWFPLTCLVSNSAGKHLPWQNESRLQATFLLAVSHVNELPAAWLTRAQNGKMKKTKNKKNPTTKTQFERKGKASLSDKASLGLNPAQRQEPDMSTSARKTTQGRDDGTLLWLERTSDIYSSCFYK